MSRPLVAIVAAPTSGKSTFFNKISGKRISIVEDTPALPGTGCMPMWNGWAEVHPD